MARPSLPRLGVALLLALLAIAAWVWLVDGPLARLDSARGERARLATLLSAPAPTVPALLPPGQAMAARSSEEANAVLRARLVQQARDRQLLVERIAALPPRSAVGSRAAVVVSGNESAVLSYIGSIEGGSPPIRFARWRLAPTGTAGAIRFEGEATALWRDGR